MLRYPLADHAFVIELDKVLRGHDFICFTSIYCQLKNIVSFYGNGFSAVSGALKPNGIK